MKPQFSGWKFPKIFELCCHPPKQLPFLGLVGSLLIRFLIRKKPWSFEIVTGINLPLLGFHRWETSWQKIPPAAWWIPWFTHGINDAFQVGSASLQTGSSLKVSYGHYEKKYKNTQVCHRFVVLKLNCSNHLWLVLLCCWFPRLNICGESFWAITHNTVDGRNPAPPGM